MLDDDMHAMCMQATPSMTYNDTTTTIIINTMYMYTPHHSMTRMQHVPTRLRQCSTLLWYCHHHADSWW